MRIYPTIYYDTVRYFSKIIIKLTIRKILKRKSWEIFGKDVKNETELLRKDHMT